jgi:hypothetical protein
MRDDFDPVVAHRFKVLDGVRVPDTWSRVQFKVLDHVPVEFTEQEATMIDLETSYPTEKHRKGPRRVVVAVVGLLAVAAVAAIAVVLIANDDAVSPADRPSPAVTGPASPPSASVTALPENGPLAPGRHTLAKPEGSVADYRRLIVTLPAGWAISEGLVHKHLDQVDEVAFSVWTVNRVYDDPCNWQKSPVSELDLSDDQVHTNFDEVTTGSAVLKPLHGGLANQIGRNASELTKVELGGQPTLKIELSVPAQLDLATCDQGQFRSWTGFSTTGDTNAHHTPGQIDVVYMVDVDRRPLVIDASHMPATSASDLAELEAILASMIVDR